MACGRYGWGSSARQLFLATFFEPLNRGRCWRREPRWSAPHGRQRRQLRGGMFRFNSFGRPSLPGVRRLDFRLAGRLFLLLMRPVPRLLAAVTNVAVFRRPGQIAAQAAVPLSFQRLPHAPPHPLPPRLPPLFLSRWPRVRLSFRLARLPSGSGIPLFLPALLLRSSCVSRAA